MYMDFIISAKIQLRPIKFHIDNEHNLNCWAYNFEHNRLDFGALLKSITGNFKSIIGSSLAYPAMSSHDPLLIQVASYRPHDQEQ